MLLGGVVGVDDGLLQHDDGSVVGIFIEIVRGVDLFDLHQDAVLIRKTDGSGLDLAGQVVESLVDAVEADLDEAALRERSRDPVLDGEAECGVIPDMRKVHIISEKDPFFSLSLAEELLLFIEFELERLLGLGPGGVAAAFDRGILIGGVRGVIRNLDGIVLVAGFFRAGLDLLERHPVQRDIEDGKAVRSGFQSDAGEDCFAAAVFQDFFVRIERLVIFRKGDLSIADCADLPGSIERFEFFEDCFFVDPVFCGDLCVFRDRLCEYRRGVLEQQGEN